MYATLIRSSPTDGRTDSFSPSFLPPEISSFWGTSIAIAPSGTQEVLPTPAGRKYSAGSSLLISSLLMTLTHPSFSIAPLLSSLCSLFSCSLEVLQDLGSDHLLIFLSVPLSPVFCPNEPPLSSIFRKLVGMTLRFTLTPTVLQQRNTCIFLFPLLLLSLPLWHRMRPNLSSFLAASNALLKPGGLLRWKVRLVKDARLLLPLTEMMKIARLTSPLLDAPCQSSPRPTLRHGRRLALLFHLNLTLNQYTLFFALLLTHLPRFLPLLTSPTVLLPGNRLRFMPIT